MSALGLLLDQPEPGNETTGAPGGNLHGGQMVGQYRIERQIGRGGMGVVYAAIQPEIGARVAIKVLDGERVSDGHLVRRFLDEARAVNRVRHPNIIDVFAFGRLEDGRHYFVMEYLEGETLDARLARGPLYRSEATPLLVQICQALEAAHREGIVHRDLKPENLWIAMPKHGEPFVKVLDFGIAKLLEGNGHSMVTEAGVVLGTPHFMSPEQCRGEPVDHRTDIYALGVLLYRVFAECLPFEGSTLYAVISQQMTALPVPPSSHCPMPAALEQLILRCLAKDPAERPQTAALIARELQRILPQEASIDTLPGEPVSRAKQSKPPVSMTRVAQLSAQANLRGRRGTVASVLALALALSAIVALLAHRGAIAPSTDGEQVEPRSRAAGSPKSLSGSRTAEQGAPRRPSPGDLVTPNARVTSSSALAAGSSQPAVASPRRAPHGAITPSRGPKGPPRRHRVEPPFLTENPFR